MSAILFLFVAFSVWAQEFQYQMEGSFTTPDEVTVNYEVNWNETMTSIQGLYQDNFYARTGPKILTGDVSTTNRTMNVILPEDVNGARSLTLNTTQTGRASSSVPITITVRDNAGGVITAPNGFALMTALNPAATNQGDECVVGFGALTGLCGIYAGRFTEVMDTNSRCDLLSGGDPRLELAADTTFRILLTNQPTHNVGAFRPSPIDNTINVTSTVCGPLPGTTFVPNNCKRLNLNGIFFVQASVVTFTGTYSITDNINTDSCSYSMSLRREMTF